ncbi:protein kinase [Mycobacterium barrassiae]|uniref:protein kinase domain-containing protein n=1 Tax=Mycobacterium barrassiae TaxID=319709 RepID=UPI002265EB77|nr:protein kinase [Mycobacterium barrassiae]MCV7303515.1 protein kinase [Mycobacterium barrassiae]
MTKIGDYELLTDFTTVGGGQCRWAFAERGGEEFFLKEFLSPTYPLPTSPGSEATKQKKLKRCRAFEHHHESIMSALKGLAAPGGNLIIAHKFFLHGTHYYKVTDRINVSSVPVDMVHTLDEKHRILVAMTAAHSVQLLHRVDLVHGDIKPPNVLLKETARRAYAAKLIDFDNAYFSGRPAPPEDLVGDPAYYSPETLQYVEGKIDGNQLGTSSDIFALGILYNEYFIGAKPKFGDAKSVALGILNGRSYTTGLERSWSSVDKLIRRMLRKDPSKRPDIARVISDLKVIRDTPRTAPEEGIPSGSRLRGKGLQSLPVPADSAPPSSAGPPVSSTESRLRGSLTRRTYRGKH